MFSKEEFLDHLRDALNHLYNPEHLRQNPLAAFLGLTTRFDTGSALQRILIDAINALEPPSDEPHHSPVWQIYEPLFYRYVEQLTPEEVADQMAISERHLRRKQQIALEVLADALWREYEPKGSIESASTIPAQSSGEVQEELAWLKDTSSPRSADLTEALQAVHHLAQKLADHHGVQLDIDMPPADSLPTLAVDPVALRQSILNLLQVAIPNADQRRVRVAVSRQAPDVAVRISCEGRAVSVESAVGEDAENLNMAQRLADLSGCRLKIASHGNGFDAVLIIPALEQLPVLVIDDNLDALQMLNRFASGTRYHLITSNEPEEGLKLAEANHPKVIVLDVMMPHIDGWELFQRFRQNPLTADIPIIVCTILVQKELAMLLGANEFLRKPFSRQAFLDALDQCTRS